MGNRLSPAIANCFLCYHEEIWLRECPEAWKPLYYRRYMDDIFVIFRRKSQVKQFQDYLNGKHPNIEFTTEEEKAGCFNFLDVTIKFISGRFQLSTYRKPTFTGLGLSFTSFISMIYKINSIFTLLNRAYITCTEWKSFHEEIQKLQQYFLQNRYPKTTIQKAIRKFIYSKVKVRDPINTVPKLKINISLPYYGPLSKEIEKKLNSILQKSFPYAEFRLVATNKVKLQDLFRFKDKLPKMLKSGVTYLYTCDCSLQYIGSTAANLHTRLCQHLGISNRTGEELKVKQHSSIREHSEESGHPMSFEKFEIIGNVSNSEDVRILEFIQIKIRNPTLNKHKDSLEVFSV